MKLADILNESQVDSSTFEHEVMTVLDPDEMSRNGLYGIISNASLRHAFQLYTQGDLDGVVMELTAGFTDRDGNKANSAALDDYIDDLDALLYNLS